MPDPVTPGPAAAEPAKSEPPPTSDRLIVALDTADLGRAQALAEATRPHCGLFKLGLEFFMAHGGAGVRAVQGRPVFLDLKLHDIPNTVAGAVRAVLALRPRMLTLHAAGGAAMIEAGRRSAEAAGAQRPLLLAVTVLTSLTGEDLAAIGVTGDTEKQTLRLARLALDHGADGLVCSAREVAALRAALGDEPTLVVPGIRPAGSPSGDQVRTMTPEQAMQAGADWIVVGRPITGAGNPAAAAEKIARAIS
jgi:orotidine-5'-phosphate decarboxylase